MAILTLYFFFFLGRPLEDEVFGLPGGNYPKEAGRSRNLFHYGSGMHKKRFSSLDKETSSSVAQQLTTSDAVVASPTSKKPRKYSLERDVYYFENDRREEVVNYEAGGPTGSKSNLGTYSNMIFKIIYIYKEIFFLYFI